MNEYDKAVRDRLRRAEGQLHGVIGMIEEGRACEEVVTQLMAVRAAVERVAAEMVVTHVDECMAKLPPAEARDTIARALKLMTRVG